MYFLGAVYNIGEYLMEINIVQKILDILRGKIFYMSIYTKKVIGIKKIQNPKTLILGSSQLESGYIASKDEYNLATTAQDLYYTYNLYNKYNQKSMQNIVISYSYFSSFSHILKSKEYAIIASIIKVLSDIDYQDKELMTEDIINNEKKVREKSWIYMLRFFFLKNYNGNYKRSAYSEKFKDENPKDIGASICHALYKHPHNQNKYLEKLVKDTETKKQKLFIIIPPMPKEYRKNIPNKKELYSELYNIINNKSHIKVIDFYDSSLFSISDFCDFLHLNYKGSLKLTKLVKEQIYTLT